MARIAEAEALLVRYSKENERLASVNNRLQFRREFVDTDYTGASLPMTTLSAQSPSAYFLQMPLQMSAWLALPDIFVISTCQLTG